MYRRELPQLAQIDFLTDSGIETDLHSRGWELPEFACFTLLDEPLGYVALQDYFLRHVAVAEAARCGLILEAPTWRASREWGERLGYSVGQLRRANERAVEMLVDIRRDHGARLHAPLVISGCLGPRYDGYVVHESMTADEAQAYHREQLETFAATKVDLVHGMTLTNAGEAIGMTRAASDVGLPVAISFTTAADGRLPDGSTLGEAIGSVDDATGQAPVYFGINCAHPTHFKDALPDGDLGDRIRSIRANASAKGHEELDEPEALDAGAPIELAALYRELRETHQRLTVLGGCCGTDARHIEAIARACF